MDDTEGPRGERAPPRVVLRCTRRGERGGAVCGSESVHGVGGGGWVFVPCPLSGLLNPIDILCDIVVKQSFITQSDALR